jgi:hypothetical protein
MDPVEAARQSALQAYQGMWAAYGVAGRPPAANPDHPGLDQHATGEALTMLTDLLASFREDGLVIAEGSEVVHSPDVVELSPESAPTRARIEDCADSSGSVLVRADGEPFDDEPGGRRLIFADVEDEGEGVWKVSALAIGRVGSC